MKSMPRIVVIYDASSNTEEATLQLKIKDQFQAGLDMGKPFHYWILGKKNDLLETRMSMSFCKHHYWILLGILPLLPVNTGQEPNK